MTREIATEEISEAAAGDAGCSPSSDEATLPPANGETVDHAEFVAGFEAALAKAALVSDDARRVFDERQSGARDLRRQSEKLGARAGSYFLKAAAEERRTAELVREIHDIDFLDAESEVDALLVEARLVKDIQPKFNQDLKDDKTFPYLEIYTREDFPRVEVYAGTEKPRDQVVRAICQCRRAARRIQVLQKIFKFRTCSLDIADGDEKWRWFRPCLLASINQCTAPCNLRISKEDYGRRHPSVLACFWKARKNSC